MNPIGIPCLVRFSVEVVVIPNRPSCRIGYLNIYWNTARCESRFDVDVPTHGLHPFVLMSVLKSGEGQDRMRAVI